MIQKTISLTKSEILNLVIDLTTYQTLLKYHEVKINPEMNQQINNFINKLEKTYKDDTKNKL